MSKFKAGDLVYYPQFGNAIYSLQSTPYNTCPHDTYPFKICLDDGTQELFTVDGKLHEHDKAAAIFHATPKNQRLLEQLHGIKLEDVPVKSSSYEIIKAMLERRDKSVDCWVSDKVKEPSSEDTARKIQFIDDEDVIYYIDTDGNAWYYATPFNSNTNKAITELPE